jgi:uncharacterized protein YbaR (Trm112 family)
MAGPIGMAVLAGIQRLVCPHCKYAQARGSRLTGRIYCKRCKKPFAPSEGVPVKKHR